MIPTDWGRGLHAVDWCLGWVDGWVDGWMDRWIDVETLGGSVSVSVGAVACWDVYLRMGWDGMDGRCS